VKRAKRGGLFEKLIRMHLEQLGKELDNDDVDVDVDAESVQFLPGFLQRGADFGLHGFKENASPPKVAQRPWLSSSM